MNYHHQFDRLGNQTPPAKPDWQHRALRFAAIATGIACLGVLVWGR